MSEQTSPTIPLVVAARVARVTVYEDRADVIREGIVELQPGARTLVVRGVSAVVSDDHIVARLEPASPQPIEGAAHADVDDARVERRLIGADDELAARRAEIQRQIDALADELREKEAALERASTRRANAEVALRRWAEGTARMAGRGDGAAKDWRDDLQALRAELKDADAARDAARVALDEVKRRRDRIAVTPAPAPAPGQRAVGDVMLRVSSSTGGRFKLILSTLVPCAAWRPTHEARLLRDAEGHARVQLTTYASVWNRTGEPWVDADIVFSTARPSAGAELPPLRADKLTLRQKTAEERRTIVVEHREEGLPKSAQQGAAPGVDDGGVARVFRAAKATVRDDGRPQRVPLTAFEAHCNVERVAFPELAPQVFLRASLKNAGAGPILAGPVTLVAEGAYVGTGDVLYVGPGESFDLSFGSDDRFVVRTKKRRVEDKKLIGADVVHFVREAVLSQTGRGTEKVIVHMRLPVSELKQLKVQISPAHTTEPDLKVDEHGVARIPIELPTGVERKIAIAFTFDTSGDVRVPDPW